ncbi:MAG: hypothetical protein ACOYJX_06525 [Acutalibacteraceae bacterium]
MNNKSDDRTLAASTALNSLICLAPKNKFARAKFSGFAMPASAIKRASDTMNSDILSELETFLEFIA